MGASRKVLFLSAVASLLTAGPVFAAASGSKCGVKQVGQVRASAKGTVRCECEAKGKSLTYTWKNYSADAAPTALETSPAVNDPGFASKYLPILGLSSGQMIANSTLGGGSVARINPDGSLDSSFAASIGSANMGGNVQAVAEQPDGKIILAGGFTSWNGRKVNGLVRLSPNGAFDESFSTDGVAGGGTVFSAAVLPDGKLMLAGTFSTWNGVTVNGIIRLNADGTHDLAFTNSIGIKHSPPIGIVGVSSGNLLLTTYTYGGIELHGFARINSNGSFDDAFAKNSNTLRKRGGPRSQLTPRFQRDGKVLVWGEFSEGCRTGSGLFRLNSNGTLDKSFNGPFTQQVRANPPVYQVTFNGRIYEIKGYIASVDARENDIMVTLNQYFGGMGSAYLLSLNLDGSVARAKTISPQGRCVGAPQVVLLGSSVLLRDCEGARRVLQ